MKISRLFMQKIGAEKKVAGREVLRCMIEILI